LSGERKPLPVPITGDKNRTFDPNHIYDAELLNHRLASIPLPGIQANFLPAIEMRLTNSNSELAFGEGFEGALRELFASPSQLNENPYDTFTARFQSPGEIWVVTEEFGKEAIPNQAPVNFSVLGFQPFEKVRERIVLENERRYLTPDIPQQFAIRDIRILPPIMARYTLEMQAAARSAMRHGKEFDIAAYRTEYFQLDQQGLKLQEIFKGLKQEYLGKTSWSTILFTEMLIRSGDLISGYIPFVGPIVDFAQASTGKELPIPGMERLVRHMLRNKDLPIPAEVFDKPIKGRLLEVASMLIGILPHILPPTIIAKVPVDTILEGAILVDKMKHTRKFFKPFLEIATDTGTKPKAVDKVTEISKLPRALWERSVSVNQELSGKINNISSKTNNLFSNLWDLM
jgi:hypothetical protein